MLDTQLGLQVEPLGKTLCARHQADGVSTVTKGVFLMIKLGKVSVETRGVKSFFIPEGSGELEVLG